ncbi:MAG: DUF3631 domain-containing protein [Nitrospinales bacterium]
MESESPSLDALVEDQNSRSDIEQTVIKLSALSPLEYDQVREKEAKEMGVRAGTLDKEVAKARNEDEKSAKGREIHLYEPEPWPNPVDGAAAITEAANHIKRHMIMSPTDADACALWSVHTFLFEVFSHSPRLAITAPAQECGKTVLMSHMVGNMSNKPQPVELMKAAPFFRLAEDYKPTYLIDEADVFIRDDMDLLAAINNGWEPHGGVIRCIGDDNEPRVFSTFCPTAIAGIELQKKLPATTISRSVVINLDRAPPDAINPQNIYDAKLHKKGLLETGRKLARWCKDNEASIKDCKPILPEGVRNRLADKWSPLFAIAEAAGGDWPKRAKNALLSQVDLSEPSKAEQLLTDIKNVLPPTGHIFTEDLIHKLCKLEDSPWKEYNFKEFYAERKKISSRQLANLLKKYRVQPKDVKISGSHKKGYRRDELDAVFGRYLKKRTEPAELSATPRQRTDDKTFRAFESATIKNEVADTKPLQPTYDMACRGVADKLPLSVESGENAEVI